MRFVAWALVIGASLLLTSGREPARRLIEVSTAEELMAAFREPLENVTVKLAPGRYHLPERNVVVDDFVSCESAPARDATAGLVVSGRGVRIVGAEDGDVVLASEADERLYFKDCDDCELERVTITGELSTRVHTSTGAAVLGRNSVIRVRNCVIRGDLPGAEAPPRSVHGIVGGLGTLLEIEFNEISGSAVAIVLSDDAEALVRNNLIEGLPLPERPLGLAILVNCDARVIAERNLIRKLGDGIQLTGASSLELRINIIEDVYDNGIASSHYGLGRVAIEKNVIYGCGGVGIGMRVDGDQRASRNFIVETGRVKPRPSAIWVIGERADAAVRKNVLYDNTVTDPALDRDVPREIFWRARRSWTRTYRNTPVGVDGRHKFHESAFLTRYGRWMD